MPGSSVLRFSERPELPKTGPSSCGRSRTSDYIPRAVQKAELTRIDLHRLWMQRGRKSLPRIAKVANATSRLPILFLTHSQGPLVLGGRRRSCSPVK